MYMHNAYNPTKPIWFKCKDFTCSREKSINMICTLPITARVLPYHLVLLIDIEKVLEGFVITGSGCTWINIFTCFGVQVETLLFETISTIVNYVTILYVCNFLFYCPIRLWILVIYVFLEVLESMTVQMSSITPPHEGISLYWTQRARVTQRRSKMRS